MARYPSPAVSRCYLYLAGWLMIRSISSACLQLLPISGRKQMVRYPSPAVSSCYLYLAGWLMVWYHWSAIGRCYLYLAGWQMARYLPQACLQLLPVSSMIADGKVPIVSRQTLLLVSGRKQMARDQSPAVSSCYLYLAGWQMSQYQCSPCLQLLPVSGRMADGKVPFPSNHNSQEH